MKKKILLIALTVLTVGISSILLNSCDKDTNCYVQVTVLDDKTNKPAKNAWVKIDIDSSYIKAEGYTNAQGRFDAVFTAPAIFNVVSKIEDGYDSVYTRDLFYCWREGSTSIRLKEGDTIMCDVHITREIHRRTKQ